MLEMGIEFGREPFNSIITYLWESVVLLSIYCEFSVCVWQFKGIAVGCLMHPEMCKGIGTESDWLQCSCRGERCLRVSCVSLEWARVIRQRVSVAMLY